MFESFLDEVVIGKDDGWGVAKVEPEDGAILINLKKD
jgi:hypothetical protein